MFWLRIEERVGKPGMPWVFSAFGSHSVCDLRYIPSFLLSFSISKIRSCLHQAISHKWCHDWWIWEEFWRCWAGKGGLCSRCIVLELGERRAFCCPISVTGVTFSTGLSTLMFVFQPLGSPMGFTAKPIPRFTSRFCLRCPLLQLLPSKWVRRSCPDEAERAASSTPTHSKCSLLNIELVIRCIFFFFDLASFSETH